MMEMIVTLVSATYLNFQIVKTLGVISVSVIQHVQLSISCLKDADIVTTFVKSAIPAKPKGSTCLLEMSSSYCLFALHGSISYRYLARCHFTCELWSSMSRLFHKTAFAHRPYSLIMMACRCLRRCSVNECSVVFRANGSTLILSDSADGATC